LELAHSSIISRCIERTFRAKSAMSRTIEESFATGPAARGGWLNLQVARMSSITASSSSSRLLK
jgi:hypothetical protein